MTKRPIDKKREAAFQMDLPNGGGAIINCISTDKGLLNIQEHQMVYVNTADDKDPNRTNIHVPNTNQVFLNYGAKDPVVSRIFSQAWVFFKKSHELDDDIDCDKAFDILSDVTKLMANAQDKLKEYEAKKKTAENEYAQNRETIPTIENLDDLCGNFLQSLHTSLAVKMAHLVYLFYPKNKIKKEKGNIYARLGKYLDKHNTDNTNNTIMDAMNDWAGFLNVITEGRNGAGHPSESPKLKIKDCDLSCNNTLVLPSLAILNEGGQLLYEGEIQDFMNNTFESSLNIIEDFMYYLCINHVKNDYPTMLGTKTVGEIPEERRLPFLYAKYSYGSFITAESFMPLG